MKNWKRATLSLLFVVLLHCAAFIVPASAFRSNADCLEGTKMFLHVTYKGQMQSYKFCYGLPKDRAERTFGEKKLPCYVEDVNVTIVDDGSEHKGVASKIRDDEHPLKEYCDYQVLIK